VRHATLKRTCTSFGRVCVFERDCTSAPLKPISTVSPKLNKARPIKIKTKFREIVVLKPGRRIFIAEPTIARAKNRRRKRPRFSGFHREAASGKYRGSECGDNRDVQFGFSGHRSLPTANLRRRAHFSPSIMMLSAVDVVWFVASPQTTPLPHTTLKPEQSLEPQTAELPQTTELPHTTLLPHTTELPQTTLLPHTTLVPVTK